MPPALNSPHFILCFMTAASVLDDVEQKEAKACSILYQRDPVASGPVAAHP